MVQIRREERRGAQGGGGLLLLRVLVVLCLVLLPVEAIFNHIVVSSGTTSQQIGCHPAIFTGANMALNASQAIHAEEPGTACLPLSTNIAQYEGKTLIVRRSRKCWWEVNAMAVRPAAIIVINDWIGPPAMLAIGAGSGYDSAPNGIGIPVCMVADSALSALTPVEVNSSVFVDWSRHHKYDSAAERSVLRLKSVVRVSQTVGGWEDLPVGLATFNPPGAGATGRLVAVELDPACMYPFGISYTLPVASCSACYANGVLRPLAGQGPLEGAVALMWLGSVQGLCVEMYYEFPYWAMRGGAVGMLFGNAEDDLWTYLPYLLPVEITIPMYNIWNSKVKVLSDRLALGEEIIAQFPDSVRIDVTCPDQSVCVTRPCDPILDVAELCIASPTTVIEPPERGEDIAPTSVFLASHNLQTGVFENRTVLASQATFNPLTWGTDSEGFFAMSGSCYLASFPPECAGANGNCDVCHTKVNLSTSSSPLMGGGG